MRTVLLALLVGAVVQADEPLVVPVAMPLVRQVADQIELRGHVEAVSRVEIRPRVTGFIEKIHFTEGSAVKAGELLVEIDPRPYAAELAKAEAILAQSEARFKRCDLDLARAKELMKRQAISREEYEKILAEREEAQAGVAVAKAGLESARLMLGYTKLTAPISGRIGRRLVDVGNVVRADETLLATLVAENPAHVYFDLDEATVLRLRRAAQEKKAGAMTIGVGLPGEAGYARTAKVDFVDNRVNIEKGTLTLRAVLPNDDNLLVPGLAVRVRVTLGTPVPTVALPESALLSEGGKTYAFVVGDKDTLLRRAVVVGGRQGGFVLIKEGLTAKDRVVVEKVRELRAGVPVTFRDVTLPGERE